MAGTRRALPTTDPDRDQRPSPPAQLQDCPHQSTVDRSPSGGDDSGETRHKTHGPKPRRLSTDRGVIRHSPSHTQTSFSVAKT